MLKTIGIMGGMGPLATIDLMNKIIQLTPAKKDQDHIHMIVDNYPQIPDRTSAILGKGLDPLPFMKQSAKRLESAGAEIIAIACNTAHYFLPDLQASVNIPILNMPKETISFIKNSGFNCVALLATDGTLATKLYQEALYKSGITVLEPDKITQASVMEGIYAIKAGDLAKGMNLLHNVSQAMVNKGAEAIIAACTEIPLVLNDFKETKVIDPSLILAQAVVNLALAKTNKINII